MMYRISHGPHSSRTVVATEYISRAVDVYRILAEQKAIDISLQVEGMPLDPRLLLRASQAHSDGYLRSIT